MESKVEYNVGDSVLYNGEVYKVTRRWLAETNVYTIKGQNKSTSYVYQHELKPYNPTKFEYNVGDAVTYRGKHCLVESVTGGEGSPIVRVRQLDKGYYFYVHTTHPKLKPGFLLEEDSTGRVTNAENSQDKVDSPSHYTTDGVECIEAIKAALGDSFPDFCSGNVIKYLWRWKNKNGLEDLKKALKYLQWMVEEVESVGREVE